jgi:hypothetical protein
MANEFLQVALRGSNKLGLFVCLIVCFPTRSPPADLVAVKAISYCQLWCGNFPRSKLLFKNAGDSHSFWLQNSVCHWAALRDRLFAK